MKIHKDEVRTELLCDVSLVKVNTYCTLNTTGLTGHPRTYTVRPSLIGCGTQYAMAYLWYSQLIGPVIR